MTTRMMRIRMLSTFVALALLLSVVSGVGVQAASQKKAPNYIELKTISSGLNYSFALDTDGQMYGWGLYDNFRYGGVKEPNPIDPFEDFLPEQKDILANRKVVDIKSQGYSSIFLLDDGTVWGHSDNNNHLSKTFFQQVAPLKDVTMIGASASAFYAIDRQGYLYSWNNVPVGSFNLLRKSDGPIDGIARIEEDFVIKQDGTLWSVEHELTSVGLGNRVENLTDVRSVANSGYWNAGYALKNDGTVWAWGMGTSSKSDLKLLPQGDREFFEAVQVPELNNIEQILGGSEHLLALKKDGTVWAWGNNSEFQFGNGLRTDSVKPVQVKGLPAVKQIYLGNSSNHSFAVDVDGAIWSWGSNANRQTGTDSLNDTYIKTPKQVVFPTKLSPAADQFQFSSVTNLNYEIRAAAGNDSGTVVAATSIGTLFRTQDGGKTWAKQASPVNSTFVSLYYAKGLFFISTFNTLKPDTYWSKNGKDWTRFTLTHDGERLMVDGVEWINNQYVLLAESMNIDETYFLTSKDGVNWKEEGYIPDRSARMIWNGERYIVYCNGYEFYGAPTSRNQFAFNAKAQLSGEMVVYTSDDLRKWTMQSGSIKSSLSYLLDPLWFGKPLKTYAYTVIDVQSNGTITLIDRGGNILKSTDGITYTKQGNDPQLFSLSSPSRPLWNGNQYLMYLDNTVYASKDKRTWKKGTSGSMPDQVIKSGSSFVGFGLTGQISASQDGLKWSTKVPAPSAPYLRKVVRVNNTFVAVGGYANSLMVYSSKDGSNWSKVYEAPGNGDYSIAYGNKGFVIVGRGESFTSLDGKTWKKHNQTGLIFPGVVWNGKSYVSYMNINEGNKKSSIIYTSTDGVSWKKGAAMPYIHDIAAGGGKVVVVGGKNRKGVILVSSDLKNWKETQYELGKGVSSWVLKNINDGFKRVQWVNGQFVVMADAIYVSKDGSNWSKLASDYDVYIGDSAFYSEGHLVWTGKEYQYVSPDKSAIGVSPDLKSWKFFEDQRLMNTSDVIWTGSDLLGFGENGLIYRLKK